MLLSRHAFLLAATRQLLGKKGRSVTRCWLWCRRLLQLRRRRLALNPLLRLMLVLNDAMRMLRLLLLLLLLLVDMTRWMHLLMWMLGKALPLHDHHLLRH